MTRTAAVLAILLGLLAPASAAARADWTADGVPLCPGESIQIVPLIVSDGAGGAIVAWRSFIDESDIYMQRIDAGGNTLWGGEGVLICDAASDQTPNDMIPDGSGGAILIWEDYRNDSWDIYAQRIDASGAVRWAPNGVPLCTAADMQYGAEIASDGAGGAIVAWHDMRNGVSFHIYAQRVNASGAAQWAANGVPICMADNGQFAVEVVSDGAGGAIIAWHDIRLNPNYDIYAQRVDASGSALWTLDGVPICLAANLQKYAELVSDGAGGAIIAWKDNRRGPDDLYAQRVGSSGAAQWTLNGVPICTTGTVEKYHQIASDGSGGAVVAWPDTRNGNYDIYAQRVNASGAIRWTLNGIPVCTAPNAQENPQIVSDAAGATFIAWNDARAGAADIYAQRLNATGGAQCTPNGFPICTAANEQFFPSLVADGSGGAIVTWQDFRNGANYNLYAASTQFCSVSPVGLDFGTVYVGERRDTTFTIENAGCGILALNVGEACDHFSIVSDELVPSLGPGQSTVVTVRFEPASAGAHACEIATGTKCSSVSCSGIGADRTTGGDTPRAPKATFLAQNYPNPFNPVTKISFGLNEPAAISLRIYDAAGRFVREIAAGSYAAGMHQKIWNGRDANGAAVSSGIYFYKLDAGAFSQTRKMVLLR